MGPKKKRPSRWQPLPNDAATMQVMSVAGFDDHTVKVDDLPKEEIENAIKFVEQSNRTLDIENTVIERYLIRMDPTILVKMNQMLQAAAAAINKVEKSFMVSKTSSMNLSLGKGDDADSFGNRSDVFQKSLSQPGAKVKMAGDKLQRVQPSYKIEIVNREIEELRNALEEFRQKSKYSDYILRCRNEELSSRLRELNDAQNYFEEKLLVEYADPLTGKLPGERFERYLEIKLQSEDSEIDKMRMKTSSARNQLLRLQQQLAQKAELGEILHAVDFEILKIENQEYQERLDEKVVHLHDTKKINGRCGTMLNFNLRKLQEYTNQMVHLRNVIKSKEKMVDQLKRDEKKVNEEVNQATKAVEKIKILMNSYTVPDVFEYILEKSEVFYLKKEIKICDRKLRLRDLALASQSNKLKAHTDPSLNFVRAKSSRKFSHA